MKIRVLDSWPIVEWIGGGAAAAVADKLFSQAERGHARLLMSAISAGEVYYFLRKRHSKALADSWRDAAGALPVTIEVPMVDDIRSAASPKGRYPIAYAAAFAAALAIKYQCPLVTGDPELQRVDSLDLEWIAR